MATIQASQPSLSDPIAIAYSKNQQSRLLSLAAELRNIIWEYVCAGSEVEVNLKVPKSTQPPKHNIGILGACKQIRGEAIPIYFSLTVFRYRDNRQVQAVEAWLAGLALQHKDVIKRFCVVLQRGRVSEDAATRRLDALHLKLRQMSAWRNMVMEGFDAKQSDVELELRLPDGEMVRTSDPKALLMWQ